MSPAIEWCVHLTPRIGYRRKVCHGTTYHWLRLLFVTRKWETYID